MLVLSRRKGQEIIVGDGDAAVNITVIDIRADCVRLGIDAPRDIPVHRLEVYNAIHRKDKE